MAEKSSKSTRIGVITKILTDSPNQVFTLNSFCEIFNCAKSTISEDINVVESFFDQYQLGRIETIAGAAGGIVYKPIYNQDQLKEVAEEICTIMKREPRVLPGGYLYMNDIMYDPNLAQKIGRALATYYMELDVDCVVTIETKGIPIAQMTAKMLNKPLLVVRKSSRLTEGTTIHMNWVTGSSKNIKTLSLTRKALKRGSKVLFIDDFMKAGGTAKGIIDLIEEFESEVVGIGVVIATASPEEKVVKDYQCLVELLKIDEDNNEIDVQVRY